MNKIDRRLRRIQDWAMRRYEQDPDTPDLAPSKSCAIPPPPDLALLLIPGSTTLLSHGAIFVFHLRGILLARGPGRRLPETLLRW